jgi:lipoprotein NlpI
VAYLTTNRDVAVSEAQKLLSQQGWRTELSIHTALIGHFAARRVGRHDEARRFLDDAATRCDASSWPYPVVRFLRGEINEKELVAMATDRPRATEIRCFLGLHYALSGRPEAAIAQFRWVKENGMASFAEYRIALAELDRIGEVGQEVYSPPPSNRVRR